MTFVQLFDSLAAAWFHRSPQITLSLDDGQVLDVSTCDAHQIFAALRDRGVGVEAIRAVAWKLPARART